MTFRISEHFVQEGKYGLDTDTHEFSLDENRACFLECALYNSKLVMYSGVTKRHIDRNGPFRIPCKTDHGQFEETQARFIHRATAVLLTCRTKSSLLYSGEKQ